MSTHTQPHKPRGVPGAGQFDTMPHTESGVSLTASSVPTSAESARRVLADAGIAGPIDGLTVRRQGLEVGRIEQGGHAFGLAVSPQGVDVWSEDIGPDADPEHDTDTASWVPIDATTDTATAIRKALAASTATAARVKGWVQAGPIRSGTLTRWSLPERTATGDARLDMRALDARHLDVSYELTVPADGGPLRLVDDELRVLDQDETDRIIAAATWPYGEAELRAQALAAANAITPALADPAADRPVAA
ncbi:hypothetical protein V6N00_13335 [Tersicoccus sp. MR15.9]|uniref:hypothetical protein n=1 Tax=Tersicoccus mangrovi TaxID=3121635 RepID=UPI002FE659A6